MTTTAPARPLGDVLHVPLADVKPYDKNPRRIPKHAVEQTAKSIRDFGWQQPIVVDGDYVIIAGHTRYGAAELLALDTVPIVVAEHLTPGQVKAYRIADNRAHDYATWDYSLLVEELDGIGTEFADVLDLADWGNLLKEFEEGGGQRKHELPPEAADGSDGLVGTGFSVSVEFATREAADAAGPALLEIAGVISVHRSRQ